MNSDIQMGTFVVPKIYHELTFSNFNSGDCDMFVNQRFFFKVWLLKNENLCMYGGGGGGDKKSHGIKLKCSYTYTFMYHPSALPFLNVLPVLKSLFFLIVQEHIKVI